MRTRLIPPPAFPGHLSRCQIRLNLTAQDFFRLITNQVFLHLSIAHKKQRRDTTRAKLLS
jgi:hypothetical protein